MSKIVENDQSNGVNQESGNTESSQSFYNEQKLNNILQQINAGIALVDVRGKFVEANDRFCSLVGYLKEELLGRTMMDITHPDDLPVNLPLFKKCFEHGENFFIEKRYIHKNGTTVWVNNSVSLTKNQHGEKFVTAVSMDITDKKIADRALLYRTAVLEAQNEAVPDALLIVDTVGKIISYNQHFVEMWDIPQHIIDAKDDVAALEVAMQQVVDPEAFIKRVHECYANPVIRSREEILFHDGRIVERFGNPVVGNDGTNFGWIWYFRDITERRRNEKTVRASEDRYQNFIRQSTEGIWRFELDSPIAEQISTEDKINLFFERAYLAECNDAMAQMYGYTNANELIGTRLSQFFPRVQETEEYFRQFIESKYRLESVESSEIDRYGQVKYFTNNLVGIVENGMLIRAWGTQRDITSHKLAEQKLRESEERFRLIANDTPAFVFMADAHANVEFVNRQWLEFAGLTPGDGIGQAWSKITHPDDREPRAAIYSDAVRTHRPYHFEIRQKGIDNRYHWVLWRGIPRLGSGGQFEGIIGVGIDITDRKNAEEALRRASAASEKQQRLYETVTNNTPDLIFVIDLNYRFTYANKALLNMWGKTWEQAIGKSLLENGYEPWHANMHEREIDKVIATKESIRGEVSFPHATLGTRIYDYIFAPVLNDEGKVEAISGTTRDITELKNAEEVLKQSSGKLETLIAERTMELQRSNEDLQQFAHVASHDLKEPVRKIRTFGGRLKQEFGHLLPERGQTYIDKMEISAQRIYSMIEGVLFYSSVSGTRLSYEEVSLFEIIKSIEVDLELLIQQKDAVIRYNENLPTVKGMPILLYQLFYNLINNSLKFSRKNSAPLITVREDTTPDNSSLEGQPSQENFYKIIVEDNGIGFNKEDADAIFRTFIRLNQKDEYEGTGLGLSLCRNIVERHGGSITAEGLRDEGAKFIIKLPKV